MISYDQDFYIWTQEQAELLKHGRFSELDVENLIEEIETFDCAMRESEVHRAR